MQFRTILEPKQSTFSIQHSDSLFFLGSCFSQNIGNYMQNSGFHVLVNPAGTLFHPIAIAHILQHCIEEKSYTHHDLICYNDCYYSAFHTQKQHANPDILLTQLNQERKKNTDFLKNTQFLFLTLGSSYAYQYKETEMIVANCHKIPSTYFNKIFTEAYDLYPVFSELLEKLKLFNPSVKVILTISPVKHIKDGLVENSFSKANLHVLVQKLTQTLPHLSYFPAFELLQEDLRDYRFYDHDLAHPSQMALNYIIDFFEQTYFTPSTLAIVKLFKQLQQALEHRIIEKKETEVDKFKNFALALIAKLEHLGFALTAERAYFENILS